MTTKTITCIKCDHRQGIVTHIDPEGYCVSSGWDSLRDHIELEHPGFASDLDDWLDTGFRDANR